MSDAVSLARKGSSHYDTLGLSQAATNDEITKAFARHMSAVTPRSVATLAQLSIAYETLRDPDKRRAYDASIKPVPMQGYTFQWSSAPPPAQALVDRLTRPVADQRSAVPEPPAPKPDLPDAETFKQPLPAPPARPGQGDPAVPEARSGLLVMDDYSAGRRPANRYDQTAIDWRKVAAVLGWPILGVAMIGGIAGWAANIGRHDAPTDALKVALPPSERALKQPEPALIIPPSMKGEIEAPARKPAAEISIARPATATAARTDPPAPIPDETQATSPAGQVLPTAVASASMPLSNATIARTIGRIGYACGQVASTAPAGGAGVFKVTCTSGHAYQARPVGGRYRFKRWTGG